jgi:uncharacterized membrane protein YdjX (TVP38/TMEM64 family)
MFQSIRNLRAHRGACIKAAGVVALLALAFVFLPKPDFAAMQGWLVNFNGVLFFFILSVLPVFGFPVGILYLAAGAKFGFGTGLLITAVSIAFHLWATHWLGSGVLQPRLQRFLARSKYRLPQMAQRDDSMMTLLTGLLPGPHTLKNYFLVIGGVRLRPFLMVGIPVYIYRACTGLLVGGLTNGANAWSVGLLIAHAVVTTVVCGFLIKRLRTRYLATANEQEMTPALVAA